MIPLSLPNDIETQLIVEPSLLTVHPNFATSKAGSALRSYMRAQKIVGLPPTSLGVLSHTIIQHSHLYGNGKPLPSCSIAVRDGNAASQITIFQDKSVLLFRCTDIDEGILEAYPAVFLLRKDARPQTHESGLFHLTMKTNTLRLTWESSLTKERFALDRDIKKLPLKAGAIYAQLVKETLSWTRRLPLPLTINTLEEKPQFVPGVFPQPKLQDSQIAALKSHLDMATALITFHLSDKMFGWGGVVRSRIWDQKGKLLGLDIDIKVLNKLQQEDKDLKARISRALIAALKHPTSPVPYDDLGHSQTQWAQKGKKVDKTYTIISGVTLWGGKYVEGISAHDAMEAIGYFGGTNALFPGS